MTINPASIPNDTQDFAALVEFQQRHTKASTELEQLEVTINKQCQQIAANASPDYCVLQEEIAALDARIKALFQKHPEWRPDGVKSVKTPYGSIEQRKATELEIVNPALTVALIEGRGKTDSSFDSAAFLRISQDPNLEALESLSDDDLAKLGVRRVSTERITIKPAKINAAKAVKAASKS